MELDFLFLIPSYNRYDYLLQIISRIEEQTKHLKYKIVVVDDSSSDERYGNIKNVSDNIIYYRNPVNNGRDKFYLTVSKLFNISKNNKAKHYVFLADDTLPSINFINHIYKYTDNGVKIINTSINKKEQYLNWGFKNWVDGCFVITNDVFSKINHDFIGYEIRTYFNKTTYGSGVYKAFSFRIKNLGVKVHFPKHSLVYHMGHTDSVMHTQIRKTEQMHSYSFIDNCNNCDVFREELILFLNKKIQIKVSDAISFFKEKMIKKYGLIDYKNNNEPTIFFGMYNENDYNSFVNHNGEKIIIWGGSDALGLVNKKTWYKVIGKSQNIAISSFIHKTLNSINIPNNLKPITPTENLINVKPKGEFIYWYYNSELKKDFYGGKIVEQIEKLTNYKFIKTKVGTFNDDELKSIYEKCFLGLRLTEHDGLSNTVVELGLMGRYCIHNGDTPNSLNYDKNDIYSIIKIIDYEYSKINKIENELALNMYNYLDDKNTLHDLFLGFDTTDNINTNTNQIKKKSSGAISNGKKETQPNTPPIEPPKKEPELKPIINTNITSTPNKLHVPNVQPTISKITNDTAIGKLRKNNLRISRR
jgi:GT2 family glycosyltransferase